MPPSPFFPEVIIPALLAAAVASVIFLGVYGLIRAGRREYTGVASRLAVLNALPIKEAESKAIGLLLNRDIYSCVELSAGSTHEGYECPEGLARLFDRFELIETVAEPKLLISRKRLSSTVAPKDVIVIGRGLVDTDIEFDIGIHPLRETVFEFHAGEHPDPKFGTYTSVFHLIIAWARREDYGR